MTIKKRILNISTSLPLAYHGYHKPTLGCLVWVYDPCFCQKGGHKPTLVIPMSLQKSRGHCLGKKLLRQSTHKLGASKNLGPSFWKKTPAATYPQVRGLVPRSWSKIYGEPESTARGSRGLEAPQEQQGVWGGGSPPVKMICGPRTKDPELRGP